MALAIGMTIVKKEGMRHDWIAEFSADRKINNQQHLEYIHGIPCWLVYASPSKEADMRNDPKYAEA